jgi:hypothetical protein
MESNGYRRCLDVLKWSQTAPFKGIITSFAFKGLKNEGVNLT